ncbi:hypothetical protein FRX31_011366, partial [Thalictrum thalictroides]
GGKKCYQSKRALLEERDKVCIVASEFRPVMEVKSTSNNRSSSSNRSRPRSKGSEGALRMVPDPSIEAAAGFAPDPPAAKAEA